MRAQVEPRDSAGTGNVRCCRVREASTKKKVLFTEISRHMFEREKVSGQDLQKETRHGKASSSIQRNEAFHSPTWNPCHLEQVHGQRMFPMSALSPPPPALPKCSPTQSFQVPLLYFKSNKTCKYNLKLWEKRRRGKNSEGLNEETQKPGLLSISRSTLAQTQLSEEERRLPVNPGNPNHSAQEQRNGAQQASCSSRHSHGSGGWWERGLTEGWY